MVVAEMLQWKAPAILILAILHLVHTPELESSEARVLNDAWYIHGLLGSTYTRQMIEGMDVQSPLVSWMLLHDLVTSLQQVYDFVEYFSGAAVLTASLKRVCAPFFSFIQGAAV